MGCRLEGKAQGLFFEGTYNIGGFFISNQNNQNSARSPIATSSLIHFRVSWTLVGVQLKRRMNCVYNKDFVNCACWLVGLVKLSAQSSIVLRAGWR